MHRLLCCVAIVFLLVACARNAAFAWSLEHLMAMLSGVNDGVVEFTEEKRLELLDQRLRISGTLEYRAPDYLKREVVQPAPEIIEARGQVVTVQRGGKSRQLQLQDYPPLKAYIESFRATLAGDLETLERYYSLELQGSAERWALLLKPRQDEMAAYISEIELRGGGGRLASIKTLETNGDRSVMTLSH